ncbi:MAG: primosomal protein N' [Chloroflexi bacterium]|nr:primosomal protein N' [Chloroflexota bacterium]
MRYAEVSVNTPAAQRQTFSYAIPSGLSIDVGQAVYVPFGEKVVQGIVLELTDVPAFEPTRDIIGAIDSQPLLSREHVLLAKWLSNYYLSPLFDAAALMLPPGFERRVLTFISPIHSNFDIQSLNEHQRRLLELAKQKGKASLSEVEKLLGKKRALNTISQLIRLGLIARTYELEKVKVKPKKAPYLCLTVTTEKARETAEKLAKKAPKQAALLKLLSEQSSPWSLAEAKLKVSCDKLTADALVQKGLASIIYIEVRREPLAHYNITPSEPLNLTSAQESVLKPIQSSLKEAGGEITRPTVFLLHGVTASGKTEIYLQALAEAVKLGKRGIVLVPEIALTPQTIERFSARFPGRVAILHSQLSLGEQFDEWQRIRNGEVDVVVGPRSALFAPQPNLGLLIIDEEHEWTYKQHDQSPRYHARDAAIKLAELTGVVVILGSATPSTETYYCGQRDDYRLLQLPERVVPTENAPLPKVEVVDLREELKAGNRSIFSRALSQAISQVLTNREQAILFLNRRGAATAIQCRNCGFALKCKRCDIPLTYHLDADSLICHRCNYQTKAPQICPNCLSRRIRYLGIGTEKVEEELKSAFPQARLLRWDSDVTQRRHSHEAILNKFRSHEADILIGTQMVAKGLDLPLVTLVGVVVADTSLNLPDFRAGERTFQLLSQVAGRAGRGPSGGQVIIQTYCPEHYAVQAAAKHDYASFYEQEINFRRQLREPPFTQLACLTYTHTNDNRCREEAEKMARLITEERDARGIADLSLVGPAPAFMHRLRGRYRWQVILRGSYLSTFLTGIPFPQGWTIDIDPVGL